MAFELAIINGDKVMLPCVVDGVDVEWTRQGAPGKLTFTVLKDSGISFVEGNAVTLRVDGIDVFYGFVVKKSRDKEQLIQVTAIDQLFYLAQNQIVCLVKQEKASDVIKRLAAQEGINLGEIEDTGYVIPKHRIDSATSYLDIMQTVLDITLAYSGQMFVLYDHAGKLTLKNIENMKFNEKGEALLVSESNAENFDYSSDIEKSYNHILLVQEDKTTGVLKVAAETKDDKNIQNWGKLSHFEILDKDATKESAKLKADQLLELHNQVKRKLSISGVFCDPTIRGGSSVIVAINLGEVAVKRWFMVESVKHHFANDYCTMELEVKSSGGFTL